MKNPFRAQNPSPTEAWMRFFNVSGPLPDKFEEYAQMSVELLDLNRFEYDWLRRWHKYSLGNRNVGAVGNLTQVEFKNSAGVLGTPAGTMAIVDRIWVQQTNSGTVVPIQIGTQTTEITTGLVVAGPGADDDRDVSTSSFGVQAANALAPPALVGGFQVMATINVTLEIPCRYVLTKPASVLAVRALSTAIDLRASFEWRERPLSDRER